VEEHSNWKKNIGLQNKQAIAHEAAKKIRNGMNIFIDAGSTTTELINILCTRLEARNLASIKLVVISTEHASKIADYCAKLGYDQYTAPVTLIVPGGVVRPNTKAIVGIDAQTDIETITNRFGKFDVAFVGANGATLKQGIVTHNNEELIIKETVIANSKNVYFCFDDSKFGIELESVLARFGDSGVKVITNENAENEELVAIQNTYPNDIIIARNIKR
jgi:DeoR family fructose operon transcriptional repressor